MPSVLNSISNSVKTSTSTTQLPDSPSTPTSAIQPKKKFRTFGIASRSRSPAVHQRVNAAAASDTEDDWQQAVLITTGNDLAQPPRRNPSVTDTSFFESGNASALNESTATTAKESVPPSTRSRASSMDVEEMKIDLVQADAAVAQHKAASPPPRSAARPNFRLIPQWGPWTVSVAETPNDPTVYNVYIKTPTHNYTLTRSQREVVDLNSKIREGFPSVTLPPFPLANNAAPLTPKGANNDKRRSSFLHTLSRFTNPTPSKKDGRPGTAGSVGGGSGVPLSPSATMQHTPPAENTSDPFNDVAEQALPTGPTVTTALAAYLTSVSNDSKLRGSRPWKRFIRVRTDDLESVRVERAIKRVRSDLAAHTSPGTSIRSGKHGPSSAAAKDMVLRKTMMDVGTGPSMLSLGLGDADGLGDLSGVMKGLSADGGFQSEMDGESEGAASEREKEKKGGDEIPPVPPIPAHHLVSHDKEATTATAKPITTPLETGMATKADKRLSALQSAFSSDTDSMSKRNSVQQGFGGSGFGSVPTTPTPANAELPAPAANKVDAAPEDVALPPSPKTQPAELGEVQSKSVDADNATRKFKESTIATGSSDAADTSVVDGDVTTDADVPTDHGGEGVIAKKKSKKRMKKTTPAPQKKVTLDDFEMLRVLGKGCAGKVLLVKYRKSSDLYALKSITKRHVLAHQELQHTLTEQAVLKRMSREGKDPFVVKLWWSFHDKDNLYLVMDFHPGGDLATQLARWGRLGRDRARFYAAEIVEGVEGLHNAGVIYRDLKPENILIGSDGHIVLTDFGLSKEFPRRGGSSGPATAAGTPNGVFAGTDYVAGADGSSWTPSGDSAQTWGSSKDLTSTFCGTAEYLAPEVIQGLPYSYEVDWWSFGTMLYEMLSGITPFWANNHSDMYVRVLQDELQFPEDRAMDQDTKSLIRGLLQRNPALRMSEPRVKRHPYFSMIDWDHVYYKRYIPPYIPPIDPSNASDTQNFDETFLEMEPTVDNDDPVSESEREKTEDEGARTDGAESVRKAEGAVTDISSPTNEAKDVFDGYSFKGRHSVLIDEEDYEAYADEEEDDEDEELVEARKITDALAARHQEPAQPKDDVSETGTIEQSKDEPSLQEAISATTSDSTVPESAPSASIITDGDSVVAPKAPKEERKQASESTERSSTLPSLTSGTTGTMSSSKDLMESPTVAESLAQSAAAARMIAEGSFDEAVSAPLPLSPVLEATDPATGAIEDEPLSAPTKVEEVKPVVPSTPVQQRTRGTRREKSGIPVLDRLRRDEDADATERDEDDWDLVEAPAMQERNGAKGLNLWQRGVVDRYRLSVFRKSGTSSGTPSRIPRATSTATQGSQDVSIDMSASPVSTQSKHKRGRTGGISLRKSTRDFLRAKSPSANFSTQSSAASRASLAHPSVNGASLLSPSSTGPPPAAKAVPSLKSKSSALSRASVNSPPSSDQSVTDLRNQHAKSSADVSLTTPIKSPMSSRSPASRSSPAVDEPEQPRPSNLKKMKKYTEGAERMFSIFGSPRNQNHQQHS